NLAIRSVACESSSSCVAVGWYANPTASQQVVLDAMSGSAWTAPVLPLPAGTSAATPELLNSVACTSASCVAARDYPDPDGNSYGVLLTGAGSSWSDATVPLPQDAAANPNVQLSSVTCPAISSCVVTGIYADSAGHERALLLTGSGSSWTEVSPSLPPG